LLSLPAVIKLSTKYNEKTLAVCFVFTIFRDMSITERAFAVLRQAEAGLRTLLSEAAASGDYATIVRIAAWARAVSELSKDGASEAPTPPATAHHDPQNRTPRKPPEPSSGRPTRRNAKGSYPRFYRQGDQLVRVAWSKRGKAEYQHKAPYMVLKAVTAAMAKKAQDGRIFSTDQLLPIQDNDGADVPSYQAYVGISLLKETGLIDQHGRQGYSIPRLTEFKDAIEALWRKLPEK
jgi:hypothetical protein